ncbi:MAG: ammonia-forming cytochrome c nitrite reductase [Deltaproteobacteria bacterium]|nr:ammonia-forming cytochrome c nitrite reductase [Deltaproteobacteria bacterium]
MRALYSSKCGPWILAGVIFAGVVVGIVILGLLAATITVRRAEVASIYNNKKVEVTQSEGRNAIWGLNFPREYETWRKTAETGFKSKHLGNDFEDILAERPDMVILWAGYLFARDYNAPRGHWHAVEDVYNSLRTGAPGVGELKDLQSSACWTCKSSDVPRMMLEMGVAEYYKAPWSALGTEVVNSIGCADCHDPVTMNLVITRPALVEAFQRRGLDINKATTQEMRSLVCAQCHVEYYFKGDDRYITFPWDKGYTVEEQEAYYDEIGFVDWVHAVSKTPMIKPQHPDWELFIEGPHGQRGLSCADCHMPYISEGGLKFSDHHLVSPLKNVANTCQTCHRDSEANLKKYVYERQDKALEIRNRVEPELAKAHLMTKAAMEAGATDEELAEARKLIRASGWRWDFAVASHGGSFHAPVETQRILAHALDTALRAQLVLKDVLFSKGITDWKMPDISTKEKAQAYIGLDMDAYRAQKEEFKQTVLPEWLKTAKSNNRL